jgi:ribonuclease HI
MEGARLAYCGQTGSQERGSVEAARHAGLDGRAPDWRWVKGHSGDPGNDRADMLANRGVDKARAQGRGEIATAGR